MLDLKVGKQTKKGREPRSESGNRVTESKPAPAGKRLSRAANGAIKPSPSNAGVATAIRRTGKRRSQQPKPVAKPPLAKIEVKRLLVSQLRSNVWNPNMLSEKERKQLLAETRRNGRPSQVVLVRPLTAGQYEIVDGEKNWQAANEAGQTRVFCEIAKLDEFEALRAIYFRHLKGKRDPLRTGRLFQRLLDLSGQTLNANRHSLRRFARENNLNETTLRNYLLYAQAAEVRNGYAPETCDKTIAELSVATVRKYLELPEDRREEWLDRGGNNKEADVILGKAGPKAGCSKKKAASEVPATAAPDGASDHRIALEVAPKDDDDAAQFDPATDANTQDQPTEPLSPAERQVVEDVLACYRHGRPLVRQKILGGLGAFPDAVDFFRWMIKRGS